MADASDNDELKAADAKELHRAVREEGEGELNRPIASLFWSGLAAGIAINSSLLAEAALRMKLPDAPWRELMTALGYPVGFLVVILGRMQLFTESTVTATLPVVTNPSWGSVGRTARLWAIVLAANLIGTAIAAGLMATGILGSDALRQAAIEVSAKVTELGPGGTVLNAVPAGFLIAAIAWMLPNAREQSFWVILVLTYLIGIAGFSHSIVGSDEALLLVFTGKAPAGAMLADIAAAVIGNLVGGAGLFALLAHGQVSGESPEPEKQR